MTNQTRICVAYPNNVASEGRRKVVGVVGEAVDTASDLVKELVRQQAEGLGRPESHGRGDLVAEKLHVVCCFGALASGGGSVFIRRQEAPPLLAHQPRRCR